MKEEQLKNKTVLPFGMANIPPIDKTRKRVSEKFRGLTIGLLCGGGDFLIFEPV